MGTTGIPVAFRTVLVTYPPLAKVRDGEPGDVCAPAIRLPRPGPAGG